MADAVRRPGEGHRAWTQRKNLAERAVKATPTTPSASTEDDDYAAYEKETGKSGRGLGNRAAFESWRTKRKKTNPGVTAADAGDALAKSK
jgi:hypothetical protein